MVAKKSPTQDLEGKGTRVLPCTCYHKAQDEMHGKGNRAMNWSKKSGGWRCTVCGRISN